MKSATIAFACLAIGALIGVLFNGEPGPRNEGFFVGIATYYFVLWTYWMYDQSKMRTITYGETTLRGDTENINKVIKLIEENKST